jgi:hypothetical protein
MYQSVLNHTIRILVLTLRNFRGVSFWILWHSTWKLTITIIRIQVAYLELNISNIGHKPITTSNILVYIKNTISMSLCTNIKI